LPRRSHKRTQDGPQIDAAVAPHADTRRRRQRAVRGVGDHASRCERQAMPLGGACDPMRFHINGDGTDGTMQIRLLCRRRSDRVAADEYSTLRGGQARRESRGPVTIGRQEVVAIAHGIGDHPVARLQGRRERARDADADDTLLAGNTKIEVVAAQHDLDARSSEEAPFALKTGDGEDHHIP